MSLFQPSTKAVSAACQEIADTVGASGDGEMTTRAGRSLFAALEHFNNRADWDFMQTEFPPATVFAPFSVTGCSASAGQSSATCPGGHGLKVDDFVSGTFFAAGVRVSATAASGFGLYSAVTLTAAGVTTANVTASRDMYDFPSDVKKVYSVRLLGSQKYLVPIGRRHYDRSIGSEQSTNSPGWYDLFMQGSRGKIRLLPPPSTADTLLVRYYRRMTVPTTSATADVVDIPQDFEPYLIAWAKWHFLVDKGEGRMEQGKTWFALSQEGLTTMVRNQTRKPDEDLRFIPGQFDPSTLGDNATRWLDWTGA